MITLISASILTFLITILLTALTISTCQRIFAKKFRSNFAGIYLANSCNNLNNSNNDFCRTLSASIAPTTSLSTSTLLMHNPNLSNNVNTSNLTNNNLTNISNLNSLTDQINAGPISSCSSTSTDQCTIDTNSTLLTNLSDTSNQSANNCSNTNFNCNFNSNLNVNPPITNFNQSNLNSNANLTTNVSSSNFNRLTNAIQSITSLLTNGNQRNQLDTSNSLYHISNDDQLSELMNEFIINQPPPPSYPEIQ